MGRRKETTEFLKECISDALFSLMEKKELAKISIDEITTLASVGRVTYFRNFNSKEEAIFYKLNVLFARWREKYVSDKDISEVKPIEFFRFCSESVHYINLLYRQNQMEVIAEILMHIKDEAALSRKEQFWHAIAVYATYGIIRIWAENGFKETPEELAEYCKTL